VVRRHGPRLPEGLTAHTLTQRSDLESRVRSLPDTFPEFMHHDGAVNRHWSGLFIDFAAFQIAVCDDEGGIVVAGHCILMFWDETIDWLPAGLDGVFERAFEDLEQEPAPMVVSALLVIVPQAYRGRGLSSEILTAIKGVATEHGLGDLIAPVRPTLKDRYPLPPMERYFRWERDEDLPFDPWLRVHWRLDAEFLRVEPRSMVITGEISEWEEWTGMRFPESDAYVVPGALLQPVVMALERELGSYEEPNVWMRHPVKTES
jgi:GNAT superfamily N-acetyltransferase